ncbi:MAG: thioredoxin family protein [Desulfurobacteriaceae bacterium]
MRLLLFLSRSCRTCAAIEPKVEKLCEETGLELKKVDVTENPSEAAQRLVFSTPTLILEDRGEVKRWSRVFSLEEVREFLERVKS